MYLVPRSLEAGPDAGLGVGPPKRLDLAQHAGHLDAVPQQQPHNSSSAKTTGPGV